MIEWAGSVHNRVVVELACVQETPLLTPVVEPVVEPVLGAHERIRLAFDRHFDCVWRYLRRLGCNEADADDGTQQAFLVLARKIDKVEVGKERAYLCRTAHRIASDMRKQAYRRHEVVADDTGEQSGRESWNPEGLTDQKGARRLLDGVLGQMPMDLRTVFVLYEIEELTMPQIAETLDLAAGTVASRLRRARERFGVLVERLKRSGGGGA